MFGLFKSNNNKYLDDIVMRVGSALHKQIKQAADEVNQSSRKALFKRMDDAVTAGYLFGYVQSSFIDFDLDEKDMNECMRKVFDGIFPEHGYSFVMTKIDQLKNADDMGLNVTIEQVALDFGMGIELGEKDVKVNSGGLEVATGLYTYVTTGEMKGFE
jgi:hypothetical protein